MSVLPEETAEALNCPLCGYDLRGLPEDRCPECGHAFDPAELRFARRSRPAWLFEFASPGHRSTSFLATSARSLAPAGFWRDVPPSHAVASRRLALWAILWLAIALPATLGRLTYDFVSSRNLRLGWHWTTGLLRNVFYDDAHLSFVGVAALVWPLVAIVAFFIFTRTLRRASVRRGHLARCVLYAWPSTLAVVTIGCAAVAVGWRPGFHYGAWSSLLFGTLRLSPAAGYTFCACAIVSTVHLGFAHARYLRLPHAVAQALLLGLTTWLAIGVVISQVP